MVPNEIIVRILKEINRRKLEGDDTQGLEYELKKFEEAGYDIDAHLKMYKDIFTALD